MRFFTSTGPFSEAPGRTRYPAAGRGLCGGAGRALPAVASGALTCVCVCVLQIFEWWYFRKYGTSFIEQVSVSHLRPLLGGVDNSAPSAANAANGEADSSRQSVSGERPSAGRAAPRCAVAAGLWRFCLCSFCVAGQGTGLTHGEMRVEKEDIQLRRMRC